MTIKIDPEFKALIPPLSAGERQQLEANIIVEGCRDPLVLWDGSLIWNRVKNDQHLAAILRFDLSPDCSENISVRRHHKNDLIEVCEDRGLFKVPKHVVRRS